ncbi:hypothetical protein [Chitinophaga sancti]|uniref:hypothetical protein n=1 Tax=Chitinophaga sancti TaxID=1004 RepID=UPI003898F2AD
MKDLPVWRNKVLINLNCKEFFCKNVICDRGMFTERFYNQIKPYSRMSDRTGLLAGGNVGNRISRIHNVSKSSSTIKW